MPVLIDRRLADEQMFSHFGIRETSEKLEIDDDRGSRIFPGQNFDGVVQVCEVCTTSAF